VQTWETLATARGPDGTALALVRRGSELVVRANGRVLMSSRSHGSEDALAELALPESNRPRSVLVGGLGLGFTLRSALKRLSADSSVVVAELIPELVEWNRGPASDLAGRPLDDPRAQVRLGDVALEISARRGLFDAILLDVDNGPSALTNSDNDRLYGLAGVSYCHQALKAGGALAVWSAGPDARYLERLRFAGFDAQARTVQARGDSGPRHVIFVARKPADGARQRNVPR